MGQLYGNMYCTATLTPKRWHVAYLIELGRLVGYVHCRNTMCAVVGQLYDNFYRTAAVTPIRCQVAYLTALRRLVSSVRYRSTMCAVLGQLYGNFYRTAAVTQICNITVISIALQYAARLLI